MLVPSSLRQTWRSLARTPVFTIAAGLTLLIGLASATTISALVEGILLRPLPYGDPGRLVGAWHDMPPLGLYHSQQAPGTYFTYQKLATTIEGIGVYQEGAVNFSAPGGAAPPPSPRDRPRRARRPGARTVRRAPTPSSSATDCGAPLLAATRRSSVAQSTSTGAAVRLSA